MAQQTETGRKVALMTWYRYENYGTALQASALCYVLKGLGINPYLVQYPPKGALKSGKKYSFVRRCLDKVRSMQDGPYVSAERTEQFQSYLQERVKETELCLSYPELHDLNEKYDAFLCGSDQIWSPLCYDEKYFLTFVENTSKIIAYAPSFGSAQVVNPEVKKRMGAHIGRFHHLSVREKQGAELIEVLTGQKPTVVVDPTLLLSGKQWETYGETGAREQLKGKYILCYFLGEEKRYRPFVRRLKKRTGLPVYIVPVTRKQKKSAEAVPFEVGPGEFVSLVQQAAYVCTDSFHGMAFSINFQVPFTVFKRFGDKSSRNQNSRIFSLLEMLGLENRLMASGKAEAQKAVLSVDFSESQERLEVWRQASMQYLKGALQAAFAVEKGREQKQELTGAFKITDKCCGCGACTSVCPQKAVTIVRGKEGFQQYHIASDMCVQCGLCRQVCPMSGVEAPSLEKAENLYAVKSLDEETLAHSSSGGVGYELAALLHKKGYAACGCAYVPEERAAKHIWISAEEDEKLHLLQGSKYIQSHCEEAMNELTARAAEGAIAFFGTPCQCAAADKLLRRKGLRERVVIVDLICHGVPTAFLWEKYLAEKNREYGTGLHPQVCFREKGKGWRQRSIKVQGEQGNCVHGEKEDDFYTFFRSGYCRMQACLDCPYRQRSAADIRMGDYWGSRFAKDREGVSMILANTARGEELIALLRKCCQVERMALEEYWTVQYPYNPAYPLERDKLLEDLSREHTSLKDLRKRYCASFEQQERQDRLVQVIKRALGGRL